MYISLYVYLANCYILNCYACIIIFVPLFAYTELANKNSPFHKSESLANRKSKQKAQAKTDKIEKSRPAKINKSTAL